MTASPPTWRAAASGLDEAMHRRFEALAAYAEGTGAQAILFTCSAFGPCIEAVAARRPHMPVLKPNEAMVAEAVARGGRIGLVASLSRPRLVSMPPEFPRLGTELVTCLAEGAMDALNRGDDAGHDERVVEAAHWLVWAGLRPDRSGAVQHGARPASRAQGQRPAGAHHAGQRRAGAATATGRLNRPG